jgi:hypothetical protein
VGFLSLESVLRFQPQEGLPVVDVGRSGLSGYGVTESWNFGPPRGLRAHAAQNLYFKDAAVEPREDTLQGTFRMECRTEVSKVPDKTEFVL